VPAHRLYFFGGSGNPKPAAGDELSEVETMRRKIVVVLLLALAAGAAFAQADEDRRTWQRLGLSEEQIGQVREIFQRTDKAVREARAELDVLKAELRRLLLREPVDMEQVEKQLRSSLEWEYRLRLAQIRRQVDLRKVLGDETYARLMQAIRERRHRGRAGDPWGDGSGRGGPRS
jgi:Spy/CpxP family protein refolding chaperone